MQQIFLHGNLVKDAELVTFGDRQQVKFTLACNEGKGDRKVTTYYDVLSYIVAVQPYLLKGKDVIVCGRLSVRQSQGKDGKTYVNLNVYADGLELCGGRGDSAPQQASAPQPQPQPQQTTTIFAGNDGLPF